MSYPRVLLPATGGGAFLMAIVYNRFILLASALLLGMVLIVIVRTLRGQAFLRRTGASAGKSR